VADELHAIQVLHGDPSRRLRLKPESMFAFRKENTIKTGELCKGARSRRRNAFISTLAAEGSEAP
jgi:hypothetical protein